MSRDISQACRLFLLGTNFPWFEQFVSRGELEYLRRSAANHDGTPRAQISAFWSELQAKSISELEQMVTDVSTSLRAQLEHLRELDRTVPNIDPKFSAANFQWWALQPYLTVEEAAALTIGVDPHRIDHALLCRRRAEMPIARQYCNFCDMYRRAQELGLLDEYIKPTDFVNWAEGRVPLPTALIEAVSAAPTQTNYKAECERLEARLREVERTSTPLGTRERRTFMTILMATAVIHYGHEPERSRNSTAPAMARKFRSRGFEISEETLRNRLKEAEEWVDLAGTFDTE